MKKKIKKNHYNDNNNNPDNDCQFDISKAVFNCEQKKLTNPGWLKLVFTMTLINLMAIINLINPITPITLITFITNL